MSQRGKLLDAWRTNTPVTAPKHEVDGVLQYFFSGEHAQNGSSHIVVTSPRLIGMPGADANGSITVVLKNGQRVKGVYLQRLVRAIDYVAAARRDEQ